MPVQRGVLGQYIQPIGSGFMIFAGVATLLFVPYFVWQYGRRGEVSRRRALAQSSFLLFLIVAWCLVLLPFPEQGPRFCGRSVIEPQLTPFQWVSDVRAEWALRGNSLADLVRNQALLVRLFNVALLVPLGVYLRRWFGAGFGRTVLIGFVLSLAFELTQLTAVWGLYDCAYRHFDVDDLVANTAGAGLGWLLASWARFVPQREVGTSTFTWQRPTLPRRTVAMVLDYVCVVAVAIVLHVVTRIGLARSDSGEYATLAGVLVVVVLTPALLRGRTPGQWLIRMRCSVVRPDAEVPAPWWRMAVRGLLVWGPWTVSLGLAAWFVGRAAPDGWLLLNNVVPWLWAVALAISCRSGLGLHERWSGTVTRAQSPELGGATVPAAADASEDS